MHRHIQNPYRRQSFGSSNIELALILPFIILISITLINLVQIYYTHNLLKNITADVTNNSATLFRQEFFRDVSTPDAAAFEARVITAIKENVNNLDTSFLDEAGNITISFEDLSGNNVDTYQGALTVYQNNGLIDGGGGALVEDIVSYQAGAVPQSMINNCNSNSIINSISFRPYKLTIRLSYDVTVTIFFLDQTFTIEEEASRVIGDISFQEICAKLTI